MTPKVEPHVETRLHTALSDDLLFELHELPGKLGCNLDRHEDIGKGNIGISAFRDIVNEPRLDNIPLILETPGRWDKHWSEKLNTVRF